MRFETLETKINQSDTSDDPYKILVHFSDFYSSYYFH